MAQYVETKLGGKSENKTLRKSLIRGMLGMQHLIAMFGATVLVPIVTGLDPSVALFTAGFGTLIFHLCTKGKVPAFLGSSFAFIPVITLVMTKYGDLRYAQGGMFVAGLIYVLTSFFIKKIGVSKIRNILPAQVVGPMIIVIGVNLIPTALDMAGLNAFVAGEEGASINLIIAIITLGLALSIKKVGKGFLGQLSILIAVIIGYIISLLFGQIDVSIIQNAEFIKIPNFTLPKFEIGAIMIVAPVVLAVFMEHIGDITTNGQVVGKNFIEDPGLNRTLLGDGLATLMASMVGGPANTTYGENTGVLAITKNYDPSILRITAVFAIILSCIDKFGAVIRTIPSAVMGGISIMLFSMIAMIGVQTIKTEKVKFNAKNIIVMATIIIVGLSGLVLNKPLEINITTEISISGLSLAALVGVIVNAILTKIFPNKIN